MQAYNFDNTFKKYALLKKTIFDNTFFKVSISPEFNLIEELFRKIKILLINKYEHSNLENDIKSKALKINIYV